MHFCAWHLLPPVDLTFHDTMIIFSYWYRHVIKWWTAFRLHMMRNAFDLDIRRLCVFAGLKHIGRHLIPVTIQRGRCVSSTALSPNCKKCLFITRHHVSCWILLLHFVETSEKFFHPSSDFSASGVCFCLFFPLRNQIKCHYFDTSPWES